MTLDCFSSSLEHVFVNRHRLEAAFLLFWLRVEELLLVFYQALFVCRDLRGDISGLLGLAGLQVCPAIQRRNMITRSIVILLSIKLESQVEIATETRLLLKLQVKLLDLLMLLGASGVQVLLFQD